MANDSIQRNTRWVQTFDRILESLNLDAERPVSVLQIEDGREVVIVQPNAFTILAHLRDRSTRWYAPTRCRFLLRLFFCKVASV